MPTLKYTVIKNKAQYREYTNTLEQLVFYDSKDKNTKDEIDLLTLLIETWEDKHKTFEDVTPVELIQSLMDDHNMKAMDLARLLKISKGYVSDILNNKKGLSKDVIRKLSEHFKVSQEAFNRPYKLVRPPSSRTSRTSAVKRKKKLAIG
jgi:HTH-type transcriptional regulator/antitoxin HigA